MLKGYMGRVLEVNLSSGSIKSYSLPERMLELYVGNKGIANRLLYDMLEPGADPLGPDNALIVSTAPMTATGAPSTNRFNITTKSPLTGAIADSNCGGSFGVFLKRAGYDILIVRGKASVPVIINIQKITEDLTGSYGQDSINVTVEDAADLWGLDTEAVQERLPKKTGRLVIGPAGENMVKYACIISGDRAAGRAGVGAVMGSKNLKGVIAAGDLKPEIYNEKKYRDYCKKWRDTIMAHPVMGREMADYGTAVNVNRTNATYTLPTRNFKYGHFASAEEISGETLAGKYLTKNIACYGCTIACGRQVERQGKKIKGPEYETLGMLGPNIMNADLEAIIEWNYLADILGMDTISLGGTLAFAMEAGEKGLMKTGLKFGRKDNIATIIEDIAYRRGQGDELAEGSRFLADKYGGHEFAMHAKGLELAAYEPRSAVGHGLGYAVANRGGCHLGGGYVVYFEANGPIRIDPFRTSGKAGLVAFSQVLMEALSAMGGCLFTTYGANPKELLALIDKSNLMARVFSTGYQYGGNLLARLAYSPVKHVPDPLFNTMFPHIKAHALCTGAEFDTMKFFNLGQRVNTMGRLFNLREGLVKQDDALPDRLTKELQRAEEPKSRVRLNEMIDDYYRLRGWDTDGVPTPETLEYLGIEK